MLIKIEEKSQRCHIKKNGGSINFLSILELTWSDRSDRFAWPVRPVEPADRLLGPTTNKTSLSFYQQLLLAFHHFLSCFLPSSRALSLSHPNPRLQIPTPKILLKAKWTSNLWGKSSPPCVPPRGNEDCKFFVEKRLIQGIQACFGSFHCSRRF